MKYRKELSVYNHDVFELDKPIQGHSFVEVTHSDYAPTIDYELGDVDNGKFKGAKLYLDINITEAFTDENIYKAKIFNEFVWS